MDLIVASREGDLERVKDILSQPRVNLNARDQAGVTALIAACGYGHVEVAEALLSFDCNIEERTNYGDTALIQSAVDGNLELVDLLLKAGADVDAKNDEGNTALIQSANDGNLDLVNLLVKAGADMDARNNNGHSAVFRASEGDHIAVVAELIEAGAFLEEDRFEVYNCQWRDHLLDGAAETPKSPTNEQLAQTYTKPSTMADRCVVYMMAGLSLFYDFSAAFVSIVDVTTDALVTKEFYEQDKMTFFILSMIIMIIAHMAFAFLFCILYCTKEWSPKQRGLLWICMIPLSQFVPMFIWIHSFEFECFTKMLKALSLEHRKLGDEINENDDPLMVWIKQKLASHGGFIMEACVEAFPQSILQMISIVIYHQHTTLNVVSVLISMTAVASKSIMLSYNMDRRVFLFNFACFVTDIFNVFAVVAWVFHSETPGQAFASNTLSAIWMWKLFGLAFMIFVFGLFQFRRFLLDRADHVCQPWGAYPKGFWYFTKGLFKRLLAGCTNSTEGCWCNCFTSRHNMGSEKINCQWFCNCGYQFHQDPCWTYSSWRTIGLGSRFFSWLDYVFMFLEFIIFWPLAFSLLLFMATGLFIFSVLAGEIFKLGWFPIIIFGATQELAEDVPFYRNLFAFLQNSESNTDTKVRLAITNQVFLEKHFEENPKHNLSGVEALELRHRQEKFTKADPREVNFTDMHGFNNDGGRSCSEIMGLMKEEICKWETFERCRKCECFSHGEDAYFAFCLLPYDILSALFTVLFPILAMATVSYDDWTMLQRSLSIIYCCTLFIVCSLMFYVHKFFRMSSSIFAPVPSRRRRYPVIHEVIARWKDFASTSIRDIIVRQYFGEIAPIILEFAGKDRHRVYDIAWVPPKDWEKAGKIDGHYLDWTHLSEYEPTSTTETEHGATKHIYADNGGSELV